MKQLSTIAIACLLMITSCTKKEQLHNYSCHVTGTATYKEQTCRNQVLNYYDTLKQMTTNDRDIQLKNNNVDTTIKVTTTACDSSVSVSDSMRILKQCTCTEF